VAIQAPMIDLSLFAAASSDWWVSKWLTPFWILGLGCLFGLLLIALIYGVVYLLGQLSPSGKRFADESLRLMKEGAMGPLLVVVSVVSLMSLVGFAVAPDPQGMLHAIQRLSVAGDKTYKVEIEPTPVDSDAQGNPFDVVIRRDELKQLTFNSNEDLLIFVDPEHNAPGGFRFRIDAGKQYSWSPESATIGGNPFRDEITTKLYVVNNGESPADLELLVGSGSAYPQMATIFIAGLCIASVYLFYLLQWLAAPKMSAVALATTKSEIAEPAFLLLLAGGSSLIFASIWIPYYTFGEDIKVLKDSGLTAIMICGIGFAVWAATKSVFDEIEGRTALTILSKPIHRRSFLIGKFVGIMWAVFLLFVLLGLVLLLCVAYKPIYDGKEASQGDFTWVVPFAEMMSVIPGLVLAFLETFVLAAISVAISTRLPMLANFSICFAIYLLGNLSPQIVQSTENNLALVKFVAVLIATAFPVLDHFNIQAAIAGGETVPYSYLAWATAYSLIYGGIALLIALVFFEDRDLA